jgi:hypothetical protein
MINQSVFHTTIQTLLKGFFLIVFSIYLQGCGGGSSGPELAEITINITGLPEDVDADVELLIYGQNGLPVNSWSITKSQTITNLSPGTYIINSTSVSKGLVEYPLSRGSSYFSEEVIIKAGDSFNNLVGYTARDIIPGTINFTLDSSLFPTGGATPSIALEGPEGYYFEITDNISIGGLVPGEYRFYALDFTSQNELYGVYFDIGFIRIDEAETLEDRAVIRPIPILIKSTSQLDYNQVRGLQDEQGNRYTVEVSREDQTISYLKKSNSQGVEIWSTEFSDPNYSYQWLWKLALDNNNNIYIGGFKVPSNLFGGNGGINTQADMQKYDSSGKLKWKQSLPGLFFNGNARVDQIGIQNDKVVVFSFRDNSDPNSKALLVNVLDFESGNFIENFVDETFEVSAYGQQLISIDNQGYWLRLREQLIQYSSDGIKLDSFSYTGGAIEVDPLGGFYSATTIDGANDKDVQFTRYNADWSIDWQKEIVNQGNEFLNSFSYDAVSQKLLYSFVTDEYFPGYSKAVNNQSSDVLSEWSNRGEQLWLRQLPEMPGPVISVNRLIGTNDWIVNTNTPTGFSQYGKGNVVRIGP